MAVSVYGPVDREAVGAWPVPARVFQVDQFECGSLDGLTVAEAEAWLHARGTRYPNTRGWVEPVSATSLWTRGKVPAVPPWGSTWYREQDGVLRTYAANWDSSD